jgi:hypothetical protein
MKLLPMCPSMFAVRPCPLLLRHCWRRHQTRTMALQMCGVHRQQQLQMLYARLRAMAPPALQGLRLFAFDRPSLMSVRDGRYSADVEINDADRLVQPKRCIGAVLPDYVTAFDTVGQSWRRQGILIRMGPPGPHSRISVNFSDTCDNVTERSPHDVLTCGQIPMFYRDPASSINTPRNTPGG